MSAHVRLKGGVVYDPASGINGVKRDVYISNQQIAAAPAANDTRKWKVIDITGHIVMAGGIDIHTHIGGGKVNLARGLLWEDHQQHLQAASAVRRAGSGYATPSTFTAGYRYAEMGYTACFEPALLPANARQAHMEMADTPMVDTGAYALLGNDDFLLTKLRSRCGQQFVNDYVAWTLQASQCIGIKAVNPGGINAFKFNQRQLDVDERNTHYELTPRSIIATLARALHELGVPHPLHIHASNLGVPGNIASTLATIDAADGLPVHLTHVQFHAYGTEGKRGFSTAAEELTEAVNRHANVSIDVGQIMFGQTATCSGDSMMQHRQRGAAHPSRWLAMDIECDAGCGVVPFRYRDKSFVNALQWAIGLEVFLTSDDPWRICLTTDHPNGAPFTSYPHLIRLLMDKTFRDEQLSRLHQGAVKASRLAAIDREYSLNEIAIVTRAAPARLLGLTHKGHLGEGADADVVVYKRDDDVEAMFSKAMLLFKGGQLVVEDGNILAEPVKRTFVARPGFDTAVTRDLEDWYDRYHTVHFNNAAISDMEMADLIGAHPDPIALTPRA